MEVLDLVIAVGVEALQCFEVINNDCYLGINNGINSHLYNYFSSTLRLPGSTPQNIHDMFRELGGCAVELCGYLQSKSMRSDTRNLPVGFSRYANCAGINNTMYVSLLGKYAEHILYFPLSKYYAMRSGSSVRPSNANYSIRGLLTPVLPAVTGSAFYYVGNSVYFVGRGNFENSVPTIPDSLKNSIFTYHTVEILNGWAGVNTVWEHLENLAFVDNSGANPIGSSGIIDFGSNISIGGGENSVVLRFNGTIRSNAVSNSWAGFSPPNTVDYAPYIQAYTALVATFGVPHDLLRIGPVWLRSLRDIHGITPAGRAALEAFRDGSIFSTSFATALANPANFELANADETRTRIMMIISGLYAILLLLSLQSYYG